MKHSSDEFRARAVQMLERSRDYLPGSLNAQEAVVRAYNASCCDWQDDADPAALHPATDLWILSQHVALGALHEPTIDPRLSADEHIDYAINVLQMLIESRKTSV